MNIIHTKFQSSILINKKKFRKGGGAFGFPKGPFCGPYESELTCISPYTRIKFLLSILITKKLGPSASRKGRFTALGGLTHTNAYHCIPICMKSLYTKFQSSILIDKKSFKIGGPVIG